MFKGCHHSHLKVDQLDKKRSDTLIPVSKPFDVFF